MTVFVKGEAKIRSENGIYKAAEILRCQPAIVAAFIEVEAGGSGYYTGGRLKVLPEKHIVYRHLEGAKRSEAVRLGLARQSWDRTANYIGLGTSQQRYDFIQAVEEKYGSELIAKSCSWGAGQIMGFNAAAVGYSSAVLMYRAFADSEDQQIAAIASFLLANDLDDEARDENCEGLARGYNGSANVAEYAPKLRTAFAKYKKIYPSNEPAKPTTWHGTVLKIGSKGEAVRQLQLSLFHHGYQINIDGDFGRGTRDAVRAFQRANGLVADGIVGRVTQEKLGLG